jgi:hypothetical protein
MKRPHNHFKMVQILLGNMSDVSFSSVMIIRNNALLYFYAIRMTLCPLDLYW